MSAKETLTIYDSWNMASPSIPTRSRLFQLEPIGVGTPYVESLTSYLARLAEAHTLLLGDLVAKEIKTIIPKTYKSRDLFCTKHPNGTANSIGAVARYLLLALEKLTLRKDLQDLTFLKWSQVFSQRNLINPVRKWCPVCYQEQYEKNNLLYEHLLWFFKIVKICPLHNVSLAYSCPHCHQLLPSLARTSRPGYCSNCEQWLGSKVYSKFTKIEEHEWDIWVAKNLGDVLAVSPRIPTTLSKEKISHSFQICIEQITEGNIAAFARLIKFRKNQVWEWSNGKVIPELDVLLKISYLTGLSLSEFLLKDNIKTKYIFSNTKLAKARKTVRSKQKFDSNQAQASLEEILSNSPKPSPSMSAVARELGYHRKTLTKHFPELCKAISANYLESRKRIHIQRIQEFCVEVEQAVLELNSQGIYPSEANVSKLLCKAGNFREKEVRNALSKARQRIGLQK